MIPSDIRPLWEALKRWLEAAQVPPQMALGKALAYLHHEWDKLIVYLEDGRLNIDNNHTENAIRPFTLGRKNWLFSDSVPGVKASANLYSLIETAKADSNLTRTCSGSSPNCRRRRASRRWKPCCRVRSRHRATARCRTPYSGDKQGCRCPIAYSGQAAAARVHATIWRPVPTAHPGHAGYQQRRRQSLLPRLPGGVLGWRRGRKGGDLGFFAACGSNAEPVPGVPVVEPESVSTYWPREVAENSR